MLRYTLTLALAALVAVTAQPQVKLDLVTLPKETGKFAVNALVDPNSRTKYCAKANQVTWVTATDIVAFGPTGGCGPVAGAAGNNLPLAAKTSTIKRNRKSGVNIATKRELSTSPPPLNLTTVINTAAFVITPTQVIINKPLKICSTPTNCQCFPSPCPST